jgi:hypothetical protein
MKLAGERHHRSEALWIGRNDGEPRFPPFFPQSDE